MQGGTYARQIGKWVGLDLPIANMLHHYLVTDTVPEFLDLDSELPVIRDDRKVSGYIRMEQKSGLNRHLRKGQCGHGVGPWNPLGIGKRTV